MGVWSERVLMASAMDVGQNWNTNWRPRTKGGGEGDAREIRKRGAGDEKGGARRYSLVVKPCVLGDLRRLRAQWDEM